MANSILVFLGHGIPAIAFILWGVLLYIACLAPKNLKKALPLLAQRAEVYILLYGSIGVILFHCIVRPTRSYPDIEHISMAVPFAIYALTMHRKVEYFSDSFINSIGAVAFAQELFLFHWHSTGHDGVDGHYHLLLQLTVLACALSSMGEAIFPQNKGMKVSKSIFILLHGIWLLQFSLVLVFPLKFLPRGCQVFPSKHKKIECSSHELVDQANAVGTLIFSWYVSILMAGTAIFYAMMGKSEYLPVHTAIEEDVEQP